MANQEKGLERLTPALVVVSVILAFAVGILWQRVSSLEGGTTTKTTPTVADSAAGVQPQVPPQQGPTQGKMSADDAAKIPAVTAEDHIKGSRNAKIFLIEYSDFSCGFCARFHPTAQQIFDEYGQDIAWVYRNFPILGPNSEKAALASECVAELGGNEAFWRFTDAIFADHPASLNNLEAAVTTAGVNLASFNTCLESERHQPRIDEMRTGGTEAGIRGTPGNFVVTADGQAWFLPGAFPFEEFQKVIDEALSS